MSSGHLSTDEAFTLPEATQTARRAIRAQVRALRRAFGGVERARATEAIHARALAFLGARPSGRVGLYRAFDGEIDTTALAERLVERGWDVVYPRRTRDGLEFVTAHGWHTTRHGLQVPDGPAVPLASVSLIVVPGVAFDDSGHRLGLGAGCYDRALAETTTSNVALAFDFQRVPPLPTAPWDQPVHALITNTTTSDFRPPERQSQWSI